MAAPHHNSYNIMVDMDQTLIESVFPNDPRYAASPGDIITYESFEHSEQGKPSMVTIKVNIRPFACHFVKAMIENKHKFIVWSAGIYSYVHAVMKHFIKVCGVAPDLIYTRLDMVDLPDQKGNPDRPVALGTKYKSMSLKGYPRDSIIVVEDNPSLINPDEQDRIITVRPWVYENVEDQELFWVAQLMKVYAKCPYNQYGNQQTELPLGGSDGGSDGVNDRANRIVRSNSGRFFTVADYDTSPYHADTSPYIKVQPKNTKIPRSYASGYLGRLSCSQEP